MRPTPAGGTTINTIRKLILCPAIFRLISLHVRSYNHLKWKKTSNRGLYVLACASFYCNLSIKILHITNIVKYSPLSPLSILHEEKEKHIRTQSGIIFPLIWTHTASLGTYEVRAWIVHASWAKILYDYDLIIDYYIIIIMYFTNWTSSQQVVISKRKRFKMACKDQAAPNLKANWNLL